VGHGCRFEPCSIVLKGTVNVHQRFPEKGTTIQLRVPLTLASIQTLLFPRRRTFCSLYRFLPSWRFAAAVRARKFIAFEQREVFGVCRESRALARPPE